MSAFDPMTDDEQEAHAYLPELREDVEARCGRTDLSPHRPHHWRRLRDGSYGDYDDEGDLLWCPGEPREDVEALCSHSKTHLGCASCIARLEARLEQAERALREADKLADNYGRYWAKDGSYYAYTDARAELASSDGEGQ